MQLEAIVNVSIIYYNKLSSNKDFLFELQCFEYLEHNNKVFAHIVNASLSFIQVHNAIEASIILARRARLNIVVEYNQQDCYQVNVDKALKATCK